MPTFVRALILSAILLLAASAFGQVNIVNSDFSVVTPGCYGWAYQGAVLNCIYPVTQNFNTTPGFGWTLGWVVARSGSPLDGDAGVSGPDGAIGPPSFEGMPFQQAAFLQNAGSFILQAVPGFTAGRYTLSFYLGGRTSYWYGPQKIKAMIDGNVVGTWDVAVHMQFMLKTATFTVNTDGTHVLEFMGMNRHDCTAFLSHVTISPAN